MHFADIHRLFPTSKAVTREVAKHLPGYNKTEQYLSRPEWVKELCNGNKMKTALKNASKCKDGQSYTNVPLAIERIRG
ncbi:MAG: hypothetical protein NC324_01095 [Bacteroides sp.]|nr:hypothetical protein [Bacteroides sp.]